MAGFGEYGTNGICSTVVGGGTTFTESGFPLATALAGPHSVIVDQPGNIYIADSDDNRVFKVSITTNRITTFGRNSGGSGSDKYGGNVNVKLRISQAMAVQRMPR